MSFSSYLQMLGMSTDQLKETYKEQAEKTVKMRYGLKAVAEAEGLVPTEEEIEKQYQEIADMYEMPIDDVKRYISRDMLVTDVANQKAFDLLK